MTHTIHLSPMEATLQWLESEFSLIHSHTDSFYRDNRGNLVARVVFADDLNHPHTALIADIRCKDCKYQGYAYVNPSSHKFLKWSA